MQTVNIENQKAESIIRKCVHCGFCLATCPTYNLLGNELDSPRGRIYLIKSALEKNEFTQNTIHHLDKCLTCRSCETTCPSGVEYGELIDIGRNLVESKRSIFEKFKRDSLRWFLTNRKLFPLLGRFFRHSSIKTPKLSPKKKSQKILLLSGCVQPTLAPNINQLSIFLFTFVRAVSLALRCWSIAPQHSPLILSMGLYPSLIKTFLTEWLILGARVG